MNANTAQSRAGQPLYLIGSQLSYIFGGSDRLATIMHLRATVEIYRYQQANLYTPATTNTMCDLCVVWVLGCCL